MYYYSYSYDIMVINSFPSIPRVKDTSNLIPQSFCNLLKMTVGKMVTDNILDPSLNSNDFWRAFSKKFKSAQSYDRTKKRKLEVINCLHICKKLTFVN